MRKINLVTLLLVFLCTSALLYPAHVKNTPQPKNLLEIVIQFIELWSESEKIPLSLTQNINSDVVHKMKHIMLFDKLYRMQLKNNLPQETKHFFTLLPHERIQKALYFYPESLTTDYDSQRICEGTFKVPEQDIIGMPLYSLTPDNDITCQITAYHVKESACTTASKIITLACWSHDNKNKYTQKIYVPVGSIIPDVSAIQLFSPHYFLITSIYKKALKNELYTHTYKDIKTYNQLPKSIQDILDPYTTKKSQLHDNNTHIVRDDSTQAASNISDSVMGINCTIS